MVLLILEKEDEVWKAERGVMGFLIAIPSSNGLHVVTEFVHTLTVYRLYYGGVSATDTIY